MSPTIHNGQSVVKRTNMVEFANQILGMGRSVTPCVELVTVTQDEQIIAKARDERRQCRARILASQELEGCITALLKRGLIVTAGHADALTAIVLSTYADAMKEGV